MSQKLSRSKTPSPHVFISLNLNSRISIFSSIFTWKNIVRAISVSIFAMLIRKSIYFFFEIDILVYFLMNNSLSSYIMTFVYFSTNFFAGLTIGEIFNSLGIKYIRENVSFLGLPLGLELSKDRLLLDDRGEIPKTNIKEVNKQDNIQSQGGSSSTLRNIDDLLRKQESYLRDLKKLVQDNKGPSSSETSTETKMRNYAKLLEKTMDLRLEFLYSDVSLTVSKENAKIFKKELKSLGQDHAKFVEEIENISSGTPNSEKRFLDSMNKYKNAQNKTLNYLIELNRQDLKNSNDPRSSDHLSVLNKFDNAANASQNELKKLQKELAESINNKKTK